MVCCLFSCVCFFGVFFLLLLTYLFFKSSSVFVSPMNSQTGIPSLAACLPGLRMLARAPWHFSSSAESEKRAAQKLEAY